MKTLKLPKFNSNKFIKTKISETMYMDSNQFLWRVHYLLRGPDFTDRNWYSKIYVDLLMAIESDLKSIIICLSKSSEKPEDAYKTARTKGHNIQHLYSEVEFRAKNRLTLLNKKDRDKLLSDFVILNVNNRYDLITFYAIQDDLKNANFEENSIKSLLTYESLIRLETIANKLHAISRKVGERNPILGMEGKNIKNYFRRLDKFKDNIGRL